MVGDSSSTRLNKIASYKIGFRFRCRKSGPKADDRKNPESMNMVRVSPRSTTKGKCDSRFESSVQCM